MLRLAYIGFVAIAVTGAASVPLIAGPIDMVHMRTSGYHAMGAAFKATTDTLRSDTARIDTIRQSAVLIRKVSRAQYSWFPAGSGARPGVKTAAKAEIWSDPVGFRAKQDAFARQADVFLHAAAGKDVAAMRSEARKLGATCKGCHDSFRESDD